MTPDAFIALWQNNPLTERAGAQAHFDDLCDLLGVDKPRDPENYCFERGAKKSGGGDGWADVWKRGHFAWENKKPGRDLDRALKQLTDYALQLESPPLLVVCDRERIIIHTAFTGYPDEPREIRIEDLRDEGARQLLRWVFTDPLKLRPEKSTAAITEEAAARFAALADAMRARGQDRDNVAHFLVQCLFCMFAEDEGLLPEGIFTSLLTHAGADPEKAARRIEKLFAAMSEPQGEYGDHDIAWFNGGLFRTVAAPALTASDLETLRSAAADMDWRAIDPTIFGTLFERGLGERRAPLGAHYTDTGTIAKLVDPLVREPLLREWAQIRDAIAAKKRDKDRERLYQGFLLRLNQFRVLDPACGSGNFLYLALKALRDVEKQAAIQAQELGLHAEVAMQTGPHNILGIEINEFAAELARVTVWIGDIQWCRQNGWQHGINPILKPLDGIENRDALLSHAGDSVAEAAWPKADVIVGNPPFIGDKKMRGELGSEYVDTLRKVFSGCVPGGADFVCYWFEKARAQIGAGDARAAGLVSTNSIRGGANRKVLERIVDTTRIFMAWSDEAWVNDGAAVRVSMIAFGNPHPVGRIKPRSGGSDNAPSGSVGSAPLALDPTYKVPAMLDGMEVAAIHADLTAGVGANLTTAKRLVENKNASFIGGMKKGSFDVPGKLARQWLGTSGNPNGRPNSEVLSPWINGLDITRRPQDAWIVDFGVDMPQADASLYELPFSHVVEHVKPARDTVSNSLERERWWLHARPAPELREGVKALLRFIGTARVAKHRLFVWIEPPVVCDGQVVVIARSDDTTFGILHSRLHEIWSLRMGSFLGVGNDPRYTPTTTFETFPFPAGLTPKDTAEGAPDTAQANAIAAAAQRLNQLRDNWLNPPEWTDWVITPEEERADFPTRPLAKPGFEAELKKRTLTNLYNARPAWLSLAHEALDKAVADAYGWHDYNPAMPDEEILRRLLALNHERAQ